jgi:hypothetical protein
MRRSFVMWAGLGLALLACDSDPAEKKTLTYTGRMVDALDSAPLAGVEVCITSPSGIPCVTTDASGLYTLAGLPAQTRVTATVTKADYYPVHAAFITRDADFQIDAVLLQTGLVELAFQAAGITVDKQKGAVLVRAYDPAVGFTSTVAGLEGKIDPGAGDGPIYNSADSIPTDATETSTSGTWAVVNLDAGTYQVQTSGTGRSCPGTFHWPGAKGAGWIETPVLAGHVTYVYVDCPAN